MVQMRHTPTLFKPENAVKMATMLNDESKILNDGWSYTVKHDPKEIGDSLVKIYDEDNEFVGYL